LTKRFEEALVYSTQLHTSQNRKGTNIPYVAHLLGVTSLVLEDGGDEDEAIAALLHDAVEDQGGQKILDAIKRRFGEKVAIIVQGCTDSFTIPKPPWQERKENYIVHLRGAIPEVRRVSLADKLYNARAILKTYRKIGETTWERFTGGREGTLWYYRTLMSIFMQTGDDSMTAELERVVSELERQVDVAGSAGPSHT
jgi:GTP pyrophosphokinase